jgi:hypothetical protein
MRRPHVRPRRRTYKLSQVDVEWSGEHEAVETPYGKIILSGPKKREREKKQQCEILNKTVKNVYSSALDIPTWKTIKIGTYKSIEDLGNALRNDGFRFGINGFSHISEMLETMSLSPVEKEIELINISGAELGLSVWEYQYTRHKIYDRAVQIGPGHPPSEVGPQLRLQYKDQPLGEKLHIGMHPIYIRSAGSLLFNLGHNTDGDLWFTGSLCFERDVWDRHARWVFIRAPKVTEPLVIGKWQNSGQKIFELGLARTVKRLRELEKAKRQAKE